MPRRTKWLKVLAIEKLVAGGARVAAIVDWGVNDSVMSHPGIGRGAPAVVTTDHDGDSNSDRLRRLTFDTTTPISPTSGYSGTSETFHGGYNLVQFNTTTANPSLSDSFVLNGGASGSTTDDTFGWRVQISDANVYWAAALVWFKSDSLNIGISNPVIFETSSSLTVSVGDNNFTNLRWENLSGRWLVQQGTQ